MMMKPMISKVCFNCPKIEEMDGYVAVCARHQSLNGGIINNANVGEKMRGEAFRHYAEPNYAP